MPIHALPRRSCLVLTAVLSLPHALAMVPLSQPEKARAHVRPILDQCEPSLHPSALRVPAMRRAGSLPQASAGGSRLPAAVRAALTCCRSLEQRDLARTQAAAHHKSLTSGQPLVCVARKTTLTAQAHQMMGAAACRHQLVYHAVCVHLLEKCCSSVAVRPRRPDNSLEVPQATQALTGHPQMTACFVEISGDCLASSNQNLLVEQQGTPGVDECKAGHWHGRAGLLPPRCFTATTLQQQQGVGVVLIEGRQ